MRVVVDTNILVSFVIRPNTNFERIFDFIVAQGVTLVSEDTLAELVDVLNREKFRKSIPSIRVIDYVEWYLAISEIAVVSEAVAPAATRRTTSFLPSRWRERQTALSPAIATFLRWSRFAVLPSTVPRIS